MGTENIDKKFKEYLDGYENIPEGTEWDERKNWKKYTEKYKIRKIFPTWIKYAAAIFLLAIVSVYVYFETTEVKYTVISTGRGEKTKVQLSDDCTIWLNGGTTIKYPDRYTHRTMQINVEGEAFFEVDEKRKNPIIIVAGSTNSYVYESSFNIRAIPDENNIEITATKGKLELGLTQSNYDKTMRFAEGDRVSIHRTNNLVFQEKNPDRNVLSWKTGVIEFNEAPLFYVVQKLEQLYKTEITIEGEEAKLRDVSIRANLEDLDDIMNEIAGKTGLLIRKNETGYLIYTGSFKESNI